MEKRIELEMRGRPAAQIAELNLDNCRSTSIMGLTDEFANLTRLSLINVGLTSLKGFPKLPKLKKLELSDNRISNGLTYLSEGSPNITNLNLSGNRLKDLETLKPLEKLPLEVLDLFNNEATSVDNYREKLFAMIPSLKYLDGFDPKDGEAPSEGEDDEDANGFNASDGEHASKDDDPSRFNINGLEIDLDELDRFEKRVAAANKQKQAIDTGEEGPDYLDEYLEQMHISRRAKVEEEEKVERTAEDPPVKYSFFRLLLMFMSIVSMAKLLGFAKAEDDSEDSDVSLSEVLNDELGDDSSDWEEDAADEEDDGEEESEDEEDEADASLKKDTSAGDAATAAADGEEDDDDEEEDGAADGGDAEEDGGGGDDDEEESEEARGKKRKHDD